MSYSKDLEIHGPHRVESHPGPWMQTFTRRKFYFEAVGASMRAQIDIRDIAHAGCIRRFGGHSAPYTVDEHAVRVSWLAPEPDLRLYFLLHDAGESYTGDWIYPLKKYYDGTPIEALAKRIQSEIDKKYGVDRFADSRDARAALKLADLQMLAVEARDVVPGGAIEEWDRKELPPAPPLMRIHKPWKPKLARARFLDHFTAYTGGCYSGRYMDDYEL
jgi:hypothetical protein